MKLRKLRFNLKNKQNTLIAVGIAAIAIILLIAFVFIPAIKGYSMYRQMKNAGYTFEDYGAEIDALNMKLNMLTGNLSSCEASNTNLNEVLKKSVAEGAKGTAQVESLQAELEMQEEKLKKDMDDLRTFYEEKEQQCDDLEADYADFVEYMANNYCCKQKVDNPAIKYYDMDDNRVVCSETQGESLEC